MTARSSSMESSSPATPDTSLELHDTSNRRKSSRARKPVLSQQGPASSQATKGGGGKRKRAEIQDEDDDEDMEDSSSSQAESDPDEEELKEQRRKARSSAKSATKRAKTANSKAATKPTTTLAVRPAVNGVKKGTKAKAPRARTTKDDDDDGTGLYSEIFSQGHTPDAVAAEWISRWHANNVEAMSELINFVLRCTGCKIKVDNYDIEDIDHVVDKLRDLQEEYQATQPAEYPLISRAKSNASFRSTMTAFFESLLFSCHAAGILYSEQSLIENLEIWVGTMSSSGMRPFRHTATIIALTTETTLCKIVADIAENTAKTMRQKEGEQKKKTVNKERVKALDSKIFESERRRTQVKELLLTDFDTVFMHRYRDVDPKIRTECATALGTWILTLPDLFFESSYLRYLGWVLNDTFTPTRAEVIKQLTKFYKNKDNLTRLRTFTDRFRPRLVEMAMSDSDVGVRASTVELLDMIRGFGLLEPDDIDNVGRLIFDSEAKVRKAVTGFFSENINDLFETSLEDFGGEDGLFEILGEEVEDDFDLPRQSWLKLKCVAEMLQSYDPEDEENGTFSQSGDAGLLSAVGVETRYALAAQIICNGIPEAKNWEALAGYLLYDLSAADQPTESADGAFKEKCQLSEKETMLLLEVLNVAVKSRLAEAVASEVDKKGKKTKARKDESRGVQESTAISLAKIIPSLLKKFGSDSAMASAVLRLEQVLDLEVFQELRQDSTTYATLLDDINKQFLTHADQNVLAEASSALLHAKTYEDLEEVTEAKVQELWASTIDSLRSLVSAADPVENISDLCNTVRRIENLASIGDCTEVFEAEHRPKKKGSKVNSASTLSMLIELIRDPALDEDASAEADETVMSGAKAILFYYMWITRSIQESLKIDDSRTTMPDYSTFSTALISIIKSRHVSSPVRVTAIGTLLDLYTLFASSRHVKPPMERSIESIPISALPLLLATYTALEKAFAQKSRKKLEPAPDDELDFEPEDSDDEDEDTNDQQESLLAEKQLCAITGKMVLAIVAQVLDHEGPRQGKVKERLLRNRMQLGPNLKEVVAYLDPPKPKTKRRALAKKTAIPAQKSKATVSEEEDESDEDDAHEEGADEDLRGGELVDDQIVDPDDDEDGAGAVHGATERDDIEDEVMGD